MRIWTSLLFSLLLALPALGVSQAPAAKPASSATSQPASSQGAAATAASSSPAGPSSPGTGLQPSLDAIQQALLSIKVDKWKKGTVRDEAGDHVGVIQRDLKDTMPPLIVAADAAPNSVSVLLPLSRNIDAVYDILLSVVEAARVAAPPPQVAQLDQALRGLNTARVTFDERLQQSADAAEKQVIDLQATVKAQAAVKCPETPPAAVPACTAPAPAKKPVHRKPKPPATAPGATDPATTPPAAKPSN